jgi:hypothetical protein
MIRMTAELNLKPCMFQAQSLHMLAMCCEISDVAIGAIKQVGGSTTARWGVSYMKTLFAKDHR